jgi:peptidoglycan/LPS O-acetylase OafA/YrhL
LDALADQATNVKARDQAAVSDPQLSQLANKKLSHLEAMRGIAALVVVANHLALTFSARDLQPGAPWFILINGGAAVTFFFVLSGYVLTLGPLQSNDLLSIVRGAIKRWPRLAGPVLIAVLLSWALWHLGAFWHIEAAAITGSEWLATFAEGIKPGEAPPDMSLTAAIAQGGWRTFIRGEKYFNTSLWTMRWEFYGSCVAFVLAATLIVSRRRGLQVAILIFAAIMLAYKSPFYFAFWLGVALAWLRSVVSFELPRILAVPLLLIAIYLLGYGSSIDYYAWLPSGYAPYLHGVAATLLILAVAYCAALRQKLDGAVGRTLGRYSFPIYLVHLPMILSGGMIAFVELYPSIGYAAAQIASIAVSIIGTIVAAHLLALFEGRWINFVNRGADWILLAAGIHKKRA